MHALNTFYSDSGLLGPYCEKTGQTAAAIEHSNVWNWTTVVFMLASQHATSSTIKSDVRQQ